MVAVAATAIQKKNKDSDDVCHYKVKYEKQHAGQPQNECWEKDRIYKKDEYSHIKWSTQIKMDSSKKNITWKKQKQAQPT